MPYDTDAWFRSERGKSWSGYMNHLTETCSEDAPRLVMPPETIPANLYEAMWVEVIHAALAAKG